MACNDLSRESRGFRAFRVLELHAMRSTRNVGDVRAVLPGYFESIVKIILYCWGFLVFPSAVAEVDQIS